MPEFDIAFVESTEVPVGLGEPPTTVVAPTIGNAIFLATGVRLSHLPIRPADLRRGSGITIERTELYVSEDGMA